MQGQTKIQERLRGIQSLIHEIEEVRSAGEATISKLTSNQSENIKQAMQEAEKEERLIRQALAKIHEIHSIRNESRIQARNSGQKEMLRKGYKNLSNLFIVRFLTTEFLSPSLHLQPINEDSSDFCLNTSLVHQQTGREDSPVSWMYPSKS